MSTTQSDLWTATYDEIGATLKLLQDYGVTLEHLKRLRAEPDHARRVAKFMRRSGVNNSTHHNPPATSDKNFNPSFIPDKNFFGVKDWETYYWLKFSKEQLREIGEFPWGEDVLNAPCPFKKGKSIKDTHFAFLGLDRVHGKYLTILQWHKFCPGSGQPCVGAYLPDGCHNENFANQRTCGFRWYLMPLEVVPDSKDKTFDEQKAMLPQEYEVPSAVEEMTKCFLYFKKNGVYLNSEISVRVKDTTRKGNRVQIGDFGDRGFIFDEWGDDGWNNHIGVAASRKS
jgi:hypothetical protein